jgi:TonB family protein
MGWLEVWVSSFLVAACLCGAPSWADLYSAEVAYQKKDFSKAFEQFKELAELGQPHAQYNLAVMYARGEGVEVSNTRAHAWASLAGTNGMAEGSELAEKLAPELTPTSLKISADIQAQFNQAALDARLLPRVNHGADYEGRSPVRPLKPFVPSYPDLAREKGVQGEVYVEFTVAADGHPRMPRILYAVPQGYFEPTVRDSVMRSEYVPARINGQATATLVSTFYNFKMSSVTIHDYGSLEDRVRETKIKAEAGDPSAEMLYAMMIAGLPQLHQTYDQAMPWFLKAAQSGARYAQYQVGLGLLQGRGCHCDPNKGELWLEKAAQADEADAQVSLAEYLLQDKSKGDSIAGAMTWLERAAQQGNSSAKFQLAAVLAAYPTDRNPKRALELIDGLERDYKNDPTLWEVRAAANASRGDFKAANEAESQAISRAKQLGWDTSDLAQRQQLYASGHAYSGNLLRFISATRF